MSKELIKINDDGTITFGDFTLSEKSKVSDFPFNGDLYKVKTFSEITKLEKNEGFLYESVPGTCVSHFDETKDGVSFTVDCETDAQITIGLDQDAIYRIIIDGKSIGTMETGVGGKLSFNVTEMPGGSAFVEVVRV